MSELISNLIRIQLSLLEGWIGALSVVCGSGRCLLAENFSLLHWMGL